MNSRINDAAAPPILVTGGTGTLGRLLVPRLRDAGRNVRVLSRGPRDGADGIEYVTGDLATGQGIDRAVDGIEIVVHLAGSPKGDDEKTRQLVRAAGQAGVRHLVYISVVGADRIPIDGRVDRAIFGYFGSKHEAEQIVAGSGIPWTTLRASQFQEALLATVRQMTKLPLVPVPAGWRFQPVAADEVASRLVELALGSPAGMVPDIAGPRVHEMPELVRGYLWAVGKRRPIIQIPLPGRAASAFRAGANLAPDRAVGQRTWDEFLASTVGAPRGAGTTANGPSARHAIDS